MQHIWKSLTRKLHDYFDISSPWLQPLSALIAPVMKNNQMKLFYVPFADYKRIEIKNRSHPLHNKQADCVTYDAVPSPSICCWNPSHCLHQ
jgi:hypothetical protein